jgi:hypothetical protein
MQNMTLISVHLPKTAGTSFSENLKDAFNNNVHFDYMDYPLNVSNYKRKSTIIYQLIKNRIKQFETIDCIHGHLLPLKSLSVRNAFKFNKA